MTFSICYVTELFLDVTTDTEGWCHRGKNFTDTSLWQEVSEVRDNNALAITNGRERDHVSSA